jgi:hypothetical protein
VTLHITPGSGGSIVSDGHVVLLPPGLTGTVKLADGTTVDLGPANQIAVEVDSHEKAKEVGLLASQLAHDADDLPDVTHDETLSRKNLGLTKKKG